jgi:nucleoside-diphosphate-sugar epimerase
MRILVTGATGFIGAHFANTASAAGHDVIALRRPGSTPRVPVTPLVRWLDKALADVKAADCEGADALVHFSSHGVSPQRTTWQDAFDHNVTDQLGMLLAAEHANVSRFVLCGSCVEYGPSAESFELIPPTGPLTPRGPYAASKAAGCIASLAVAHERRLRMAYLRVFHVFGLGQYRDNLWPSLRAAALSGVDYPMTPGNQVRDFVPVEDVAATFLDVCVNRPLEPGRPEVHNVGSGRPVTLLAFAEHWWRKWGATGRLLPGAIPYRSGEVMRYVPELTL